MESLSRSVKSVRLKVEEKDVSFKAGQWQRMFAFFVAESFKFKCTVFPSFWLDLHIPGVSTVGGFSMYSSPSQLLKDRTLDLAVKYSRHPPALWIHEKVRISNLFELFLLLGFMSACFVCSAQSEMTSAFVWAATFSLTPVMSLLPTVHSCFQQVELGSILLLRLCLKCVNRISTTTQFCFTVPRLTRNYFSRFEIQ